MKRVLGTWLVLLFARSVSTQPAYGQISPGPLSEAHKHLEGAVNCTACHTLAVGAPRFKCLGCHEEIKARLDAKRGFHAQAVKLNRGGKQECVRCHSDHFGRIFNIVKWETSRDEFDHRQTGYPLQGKHAGLACARCHSPNHIASAERKKIRVRDARRTFLGLNTACGTCHEDPHKTQLGAGCQRCHTSFSQWKPAAGFSHESTAYPLTGKHEQVACARCHPNVTEAGKTLTKFKGIGFQSCSDCHRDPHNGAFAGSCQSCHITAGWKQVNLSSGFDHSKTKFPLLGLHATTGCFECHKSSNFKEPVQHALCSDCHAKDDPHKAQFPKQDCAACHVEKGFKPSTFTVSSHQKSAYPLVGKHAAVECAKCHPPAGRDTLYRVKYEGCIDCHKDVHEGQMLSKSGPERCESCHTETGFQPSTFTLARHQQTGFALGGAHAATACSECHKPAAGRYPPGPPQYHFASFACTGCHLDPHQNQFAGKLAGTCESCHSTKTWQQTLAFDHEATGFTLAGAHRAVACTECHRPANFGTTARQIVFRGAPRACAGCHEDIHGHQFDRAGTPADCGSCHSLLVWKPTTFDHDTRSTFSLTGSHKQVPCASCHKDKVEVSGRMAVLYKQTPSRCSACHSD